MAQLTIEEIGARLYVRGNTFPVKDRLRAIGCHVVKNDAGQWETWIGKGKRAELEKAIAASASAGADDMLKRDRENIIGRARYDGHDYYLVGEGSNDRGAWVRLLFRDGSKTFFKPRADVEITRRYDRAQTLDGLRAYAERMRKNPQSADECRCSCHRRSDCTCAQGFCGFHHDGCDRCGCES